MRDRKRGQNAARRGALSPASCLAPEKTETMRVEKSAGRVQSGRDGGIRAPGPNPSAPRAGRLGRERAVVSAPGRCGAVKPRRRGSALTAASVRAGRALPAGALACGQEALRGGRLPGTPRFLMHTQTHTQTHRHTDTQTHRHTDTQAQTHTCVRTHTHTDTHMRARTHTHTHTHTPAWPSHRAARSTAERKEKVNVSAPATHGSCYCTASQSSELHRQSALVPSSEWYTGFKTTGQYQDPTSQKARRTPNGETNTGLVTVSSKRTHLFSSNITQCR